LVGSDPETFAREAERLWCDEDAYREMAVARFPYGDGKAAERIAEILVRDLSEPER
jgi:UDP-N-acetylglucosamine 2-epimerase (non-hydrolysing)